MSDKLSIEPAIDNKATVLWEGKMAGTITHEDTTWTFEPLDGIHHKRLAVIERELREFMAGPLMPEDSELQDREEVNSSGSYPEGIGSNPIPATNDPEPEQSHEAGDKTPAYVAWFQRNHTPAEFEAKYGKRKVTL